MSLCARTVFVTGASRGLGLEFVKQIAQLPKAPEVLIAACRSPDTAIDLQALAKSHPSIKIVKCDVQNDEDIESAFEETKSAVGDLGLNLLINNAGINDKASGGGIFTQTREMMQTHFNVNVTSALMISQKFLPLIQQAVSQSKSPTLSCNKAAIVMISSIMGSQELVYSQFQGGPGTGLHYRCSKTAITMASILMSKELKQQGILVTALHPGWVQTDMGSDKAPVGTEESIQGCLKVIGGAGEKQNGRLVTFQGEVLPF